MHNLVAGFSATTVAFTQDGVFLVETAVFDRGSRQDGPPLTCDGACQASKRGGFGNNGPRIWHVHAVSACSGCRWPVADEMIRSRDGPAWPAWLSSIVHFQRPPAKQAHLTRLTTSLVPAGAPTNVQPVCVQLG